jgi:hypothetical protein
MCDGTMGGCVSPLCTSLHCTALPHPPPPSTATTTMLWRTACTGCDACKHRSAPTHALHGTAPTMGVLVNRRAAANVPPVRRAAAQHRHGAPRGRCHTAVAAVDCGCNRIFHPGGGGGAVRGGAGTAAHRRAPAAAGLAHALGHQAGGPGVHFGARAAAPGLMLTLEPPLCFGVVGARWGVHPARAKHRSVAEGQGSQRGCVRAPCGHRHVCVVRGGFPALIRTRGGRTLLRCTTSGASGSRRP